MPSLVRGKQTIRPLAEMFERVTGKRARRTLSVSVQRLQEEWPVEDGTRDVTILTAGVPKIVVTAVRAPSAVIPGDTFTIDVDWRNDGLGGEGYIQIQDLDTGAIVVYIKRFVASAGATGTWVSPSLTMPDKTWRLRIYYGHYEIRYGPK